MVPLLGGDVIEPVFVKSALETFTILIDTREHETSALTQRIQQMGCPVERQKLNFGDYSAKVILPTGVPYSLENIVVVERKMSSDEIANCFTSQRARFTREFERAKAAGARTYLLVERTTWEMLYAGTYRSKMTPVAMVASLTTWLARYDCKLIFCEPQTSGKLIHDILYREMKQHLEGFSHDASRLIR